MDIWIYVRLYVLFWPYESKSKTRVSKEYHCNCLTRQWASSNHQVIDHFYWLIPAAVCWAEAKKTGLTHKTGPIVMWDSRKRWLLRPFQVFNCGGHSSVLEKIDVWHMVPKVEWILSQFNAQRWLSLFVFVEFFELRTETFRWHGRIWYKRRKILNVKLDLSVSFNCSRICTLINIPFYAIYLHFLCVWYIWRWLFGAKTSGGALFWETET